MSSPLGNDLARNVRGEVLFDGSTRAIYATDSSNYRHVPLGVVCPLDEQDIIATIEICRRVGAPVLARGAGTSLAGQGCNEAVVLDTSRHMGRILAVDPVTQSARVEPGVVLDDLRRAAAPHGLTFGPDPATHAWCTLGGMIGNNSCGTHSLTAGRTSDNVERLVVVTYGGSRLDLGAYDDAGRTAVVARGGEHARVLSGLFDLVERHGRLIGSGYPRLDRRVSGYNLDELLPENGFNVARALVGSESTCVVITEATVSLVRNLPRRRLVVLGYRDVFAAADRVPELLGHSLAALEGFDDVLVDQMRSARLHLDHLRLLPKGNAFLLAEIADETDAGADQRAGELARQAAGTTGRRVLVSEADQEALWRIRESGLGATARPEGKPANLEGWEDAAVPPGQLGTYLRGIAELWARHGYRGAWYGHFGQGCVHTRNNFDFRSAEGLARYRSYVEEAARLCVGLGGSLSGEHGDGQARGELLRLMYGDELVGVFGAFKDIWDPTARMNPGRLVHPRPLDEDLRYGPSYRDVTLGPTRLSFSRDGGSLQRASERCVGVGRCRSSDGGVMCPSFRATGDERHSTRGRAKLLVEMFQGEVTPASWRNEEVREALSLCLSCKGCAVECPTGVDMASYKAEFLSHYYEGRLRPPADYVFGLLPWLVRPATRLPRLSNALLGEHGVSRAARRLAGITVERPAPRIAKVPFSRYPTARSRRGDLGATVVLFPDTFSNAYRPERAEATLRVLEAAGERVAVPSRWACCGRTLFDSGMLDLARRTLRHLLDVLEPWAARGVPIIVPEPSCLASFRDELGQLLGDDPRAASVRDLSRSLGEHLVARSWRAAEPVRGRRAAIHPHCHQRASGGTGADQAVLEAAGFEVEVLDAGCCGLAGSFGFHAANDTLSRAVASLGFRPALAALEAGTDLVIDGFSCALQAEQLEIATSRSLAEVLASTARGSGGGLGAALR